MRASPLAPLARIRFCSRYPGKFLAPLAGGILAGFAGAQSAQPVGASALGGPSAVPTTQGAAAASAAGHALRPSARGSAALSGAAGNVAGPTTIGLGPAIACTANDDGSSEISCGGAAAGQIWLVRFGDVGACQVVSSVSTTFGSVGFPGSYTPAMGDMVTVAVWDDPNDDGDPSDAVLLATASAPVSAGSIDSDVFQTVPLGVNVVTDGIFFAGASVYGGDFDYPIPMDNTAAGTGRSWIASNLGMPADLAVLTANSFGPVPIAISGCGDADLMLRIDCDPCVECSDSHAGVSEDSLGCLLGPSGRIGWLVRYGDVGFCQRVSAVRTTFGSLAGAMITGMYTPAPGDTVTVAVWDDPNDDGNPIDAVLLGSATVPISMAAVNTDVMQLVPLPSPVQASGVFFAGATVSTPFGGSGQFPAPEEGLLPVSGRAWSACNAGPINMVTLSANTFLIPEAIDYLLGIDCGSCVAGTPFCFGAGGMGSTPCPCGGVGAAGNGCPNSGNGAGANLAASGVASLTADTLQLSGTGMPSKSCFYYQGTAMQSGGAGIVFGDGLRCAGGVPVLLGYRLNMAGASMFPGMMGVPISMAGGVMAPGTRTYQVTYQDTVAFCTPSQFNHTNGVSVFWGL